MINSEKAEIVFTLFDADGAEVEHRLPGKFEVCHRCRGEGKHTNPSIDGNGITASEMAELGDDFREDYVDGFYDVTCQTCHGRRVVAVADKARWSPAQKKAYREHLRIEEESRRDDASEAWLRRAEMGADY